MEPQPPQGEGQHLTSTASTSSSRRTTTALPSSPSWSASASARSDPIADGIRQCDSVTHPIAISFVPEDRHQQCLAALDAVAARFARDERSIVRQTSRWDFEWARISLVGVRAWEGQMY